MSTKAEKKRRQFAERERRRKIEEELSKNWICDHCKIMVQHWSPICLCGRLRPEVKL